MVQLFIQRLAEEVMENLFERDQKYYTQISDALDELRQKGLQSSNLKKIKGTKNIYRKRSGRWRILFTAEGSVFKVWIVEMEKSTRTDYLRWIFHIQKQT